MPDGEEQRGNSARKAPHLEPFRFKKGQSGNPRGRTPDAERFEAVAKRILRELAPAPKELGLVPGKRLRREELVARTLIAAAQAGDLEAQRIVLDRLWPRPQKIELELPLEALADAEDALERRIQKAIASRRAPGLLHGSGANGFQNGHANGHGPEGEVH